MTSSLKTDLAGILFDRDGTLVVDVAFNDDPDRVAPVPYAAEAVAEARRFGLHVGVATNQPGLGEGRLAAEALWDVNRRVDELCGPFDLWLVCPHARADGCDCRKPRPGMIAAAAEQWRISASRIALIGDTAADVGAAAAAGARSVLVPNAATRPEEVADAPLVAADPLEAVRLLLGVGTGDVAGATRETVWS